MVTNLRCSISRKQVALMCLCYRWVDDETPPVDRFADSASSRDEPDTPKHPMRMECWRFPAEVYTHPLEHPKDQISDRRLTRLKATKHSKFRVVRWIGDHDVVTSSPSSTSASAVETRGRSTDASLTAWYVQHAASRPRGLDGVSDVYLEVGCLYLGIRVNTKAKLSKHCCSVFVYPLRHNSGSLNSSAL